MPEICPYCSTLLTTSLRFCVNCRRSVTETKISVRDAEEEEAERRSKFKLSRKSTYEFHRQIRTIFFTASTLVFLLVAYVYAMRAINQPIPGEQEVLKIFNQLKAAAHI